jgi:YihY family inner membrane protein
MNMAERAKRALHAADEYQQRTTWLAVPVAVWKKFGDDTAGNLAALVAYYSFVSIFPLLLVLFTVLDIVLNNHPALRHQLVNSALSHYPVIGSQLQGNIGSLHGSPLALTIGLLGTFIGARSVAFAMQNALNAVWEIPITRRPAFPWSWLRSFGLILVIGLGLIGTTVLSGMAAGAGKVLPGPGAAVAAVVVSLILNVGFFWLAFRLGTASEISWRRLLLGAVIGGIIWQVLQFVGGYFVSHQLAHASPEYGTFAVVLGLIAWLYLEAELTLYAAQINVVIAYRLYPRSIVSPPYTGQDRRAQQLYAEAAKRSDEMEIVVEAPQAQGGEDDREKTSG